jgi:hypothetical protein
MIFYLHHAGTFSCLTAGCGCHLRQDIGMTPSRCLIDRCAALTRPIRKSTDPPTTFAFPVWLPLSKEPMRGYYWALVATVAPVESFMVFPVIQTSNGIFQ